MQSNLKLEYLDVDRSDNVKIVKFSGDLDATNIEGVMNNIFSLINSGYSSLVADFSNLRYVNSTGLGILLHVSKTAEEKDGFFKIAAPNDNVLDVIEIIGANTLLEIYSSVEEAIDSI